MDDIANTNSFQFLAYGILHLGGVRGLYGWQWLFALEGTLTGVIGVLSWFYLPASPTQTASRFRGKNGWFNEYEEKIMVNRVLRDDPSKGDMHNRQGLSWDAFRTCISDYHMWPVYLLGLTWLIPTVPMQGYITLNMTEAGFGTFETNLLVIPAFVLFIIGLLVSSDHPSEAVFLYHHANLSLLCAVLDMALRKAERTLSSCHRFAALGHSLSGCIACPPSPTKSVGGLDPICSHLRYAILPRSVRGDYES